MVFISIRLASESDRKDIYDWRNDKITRQMSIDSNIIKWENHLNWFEKSLSCNKKILIICEGAYRNKISFVKFDVNENIALISINFNPRERGKGLAKYCLINSINFFFKYFQRSRSFRSKNKRRKYSKSKNIS